MNKLTRKDLLVLPQRIWNGVGIYDSLIVYPNGHKHDSGYSCITIIGVNERKPVELVTRYSDDISWFHNGHKLRSDALLKCRAMHFWANEPNVKFHVGPNLSSIEVNMCKVAGAVKRD